MPDGTPLGIIVGVVGALSGVIGVLIGIVTLAIAGAVTVAVAFASFLAGCGITAAVIWRFQRRAPPSR
jgi:hypothetical protein